MSNQDRTPGPWYSQPDDPDPEMATADYIRAEGSDEMVAKVFYREDTAFILRAVNAHDTLLAACKNIVESAFADARSGCIQITSAALADVQAAIAAAEGGQEKER